VNNPLLLLTFVLLLGNISIAQDSGSVYTMANDQKKKEEKLQGFESGDYEEMNPLAPAKAAFYSAVLPGLGQAYNKRYWKIPLVYAAIGSSAYAYVQNNKVYHKFRDAFKSRRMGFTTDPYYDLNDSGIVIGQPDVSDSSLQTAQERAQEARDFSLVLTIGMYALNIIDANVDAHLKQFNVNEDLSVDYRPDLLINPVTNSPYLGMTINLTY
jgi:hypothetical protein